MVGGGGGGGVGVGIKLNTRNDEVVLVHAPATPPWSNSDKHAKQCIALTRLQIRHCQRQARWEGKSVVALHGELCQHLHPDGETAQQKCAPSPPPPPQLIRHTRVKTKTRTS